MYICVYIGPRICMNTIILIIIIIMMRSVVLLLGVFSVAMVARRWAGTDATVALVAASSDASRVPGQVDCGSSMLMGTVMTTPAGTAMAPEENGSTTSRTITVSVCF